jgi:hypothetical protein
MVVRRRFVSSRFFRTLLLPALLTLLCSSGSNQHFDGAGSSVWPFALCHVPYVSATLVSSSGYLLDVSLSVPSIHAALSLQFCGVDVAATISQLQDTVQSQTALMKTFSDTLLALTARLTAAEESLSALETRSAAVNATVLAHTSMLSSVSASVAG